MFTIFTTTNYFENISITPKWMPVFSKQPLPNLLDPGTSSLYRLPVYIKSLLGTFYMKGIIWSFCDSLLSFHVMFPRFIHVVTCIRSPLFCFCFFFIFWQNDLPLYVYTTTLLSICLLMDIRIVSTYRLLWNFCYRQYWACIHMYLFGSLFLIVLCIA